MRRNAFLRGRVVGPTVWKQHLSCGWRAEGALFCVLQNASKTNTVASGKKMPPAKPKFCLPTPSGKFLEVSSRRKFCSTHYCDRKILGARLGRNFAKLLLPENFCSPVRPRFLSNYWHTPHRRPWRFGHFFQLARTFVCQLFLHGTFVYCCFIPFFPMFQETLQCLQELIW